MIEKIVTTSDGLTSSLSNEIAHSRNLNVYINYVSVVAALLSVTSSSLSEKLESGCGYLGYPKLSR